MLDRLKEIEKDFIEHGHTEKEYPIDKDEYIAYILGDTSGITKIRTEITMMEKRNELKILTKFNERLGYMESITLKKEPHEDA